MTAPQCSLCGSDIPEGAPHESWEWDDKDALPAKHLVTLYAHPGCHRVRLLIDVRKWEEGHLSDLVAEWIEDANTTIEREDRARLAAEEAAGCEFAAWAVHQANR